VAIADEKPARATSSAEAELDAFLSGLRVAWKEGEVRPTRRPKPSKPRYRTVPDPFAAVTEQMKAWFDGEPGITGRELVDRLQAAAPETYPEQHQFSAGQRSLSRGMRGMRSPVSSHVGDVRKVSSSSGAQTNRTYRAYCSPRRSASVRPSM
jgi:hypothetical protein